MRIAGKYRSKSDFVICPRCGLKNLISTESCPDCGLVFSRLKIATNKDAKRKIRRGDRDYIIRTSNLPSDVSRTKLILLTVFTGLFGGHCFYVGRYWRGMLLLLNFIALMMYVVFNTQLVAIDEGKLIAALSTISGIIMMVWAFDIVWVIMKKFKVPIAIDLKAENEEGLVEDGDQPEEQIQNEEIIKTENDVLGQENKKEEK